MPFRSSVEMGQRPLTTANWPRNEHKPAKCQKRVLLVCSKIFHAEHFCHLNKLNFRAFTWIRCLYSSFDPWPAPTLAHFFSIFWIFFFAISSKYFLAFAWRKNSFVCLFTLWSQISQLETLLTIFSHSVWVRSISPTGRYFHSHPIYENCVAFHSFYDYKVSRSVTLAAMSERFNESFQPSGEIFRNWQILQPKLPRKH